MVEHGQLPAWFAAVRNLENPVASAYLQSLLLTGARREELAALRWEDVDFKWRSLAIKDKVETDTGRTIPLTPYVAELLLDLKRRNGLPPTKKVLAKFEKQGQGWAPSPWVFESSRDVHLKLGYASLYDEKKITGTELQINDEGARKLLQLLQTK